MVAGMAEAGQSCDEPLHEKKKDALIRTFWQRFDLWGSTPCRWDDDLDGQDATQGRLDDFWSMWQRAGLLWHTCRLQEPQRGQRLSLLDADYALKGPTSPL
jgi:hypothetical protein